MLCLLKIKIMMVLGYVLNLIGSKRYSSFTLNISLKEAQKLNFIDDNGDSYILKKEIIDNKLIISRSTDGHGVKLCKKRSRHYISSYNLNISCKEAVALNLVKQLYYGLVRATASKTIVDDTLVVTRAFPQTASDLIKLIDDFGLVGKHLSKRTLLEFLHFIEGDCSSYFKQRDKIYDSIRVNKRTIWYQGQFCFFSFNIRLDQNRVIKSVFYVSRTPYDFF